MKIILSNPTDYVIVKEQKRTITEVEVLQIVDRPNEKKVEAFTSVGYFILWKGSAYDAIGQWTDEDAIQEITRQITQ